MRTRDRAEGDRPRPFLKRNRLDTYLTIEFLKRRMPEAPMCPILTTLATGIFLFIAVLGIVLATWVR